MATIPFSRSSPPRGSSTGLLHWQAGSLLFATRQAVMNWPTAAARTQAEVPECTQCARQLILAFCLCLVLDGHSRGLRLYSKGERLWSPLWEACSTSPSAHPGLRDGMKMLQDVRWSSPLLYPAVCAPVLLSSTVSAGKAHVTC